MHTHDKDDDDDWYDYSNDYSVDDNDVCPDRCPAERHDKSVFSSKLHAVLHPNLKPKGTKYLFCLLPS